MTDAIFRFIVGGLVVSAFSLLGDVLKPKSFAGLFGAAPSVALATILLTVSHEGASYASIEARSMVFGAVAFFVYAHCVANILMHHKFSAAVVAALSIALWLGVAIGLKAVWLE
jgi:hypothetical protein